MVVCAGGILLAAEFAFVQAMDVGLGNQDPEVGGVVGWEGVVGKPVVGFLASGDVSGEEDDLVGMVGGAVYGPGLVDEVQEVGVQVGPDEVGEGCVREVEEIHMGEEDWDVTELFWMEEVWVWRWEVIDDEGVGGWQGGLANIGVAAGETGVVEVVVWREDGCGEVFIRWSDMVCARYDRGWWG